MRVLVTGSAGFLGRHVVARITHNPQIEKVIGYDHFDPLCGANQKEIGVMTLSGDVTDIEYLALQVKHYKITHIIHLAAYGRNLTCAHFPFRAGNVNVNGTLNVLEVARALKLQRVVVCSSNITLSDQITVYRESKKAVENLVELYASMGLSVLGLRPSNIAGPGQSRTEYQPCSFAGMDLGFERDSFISITGDGTQSRDFVNVKDVTRAFKLALFSDYVGATFDVCTGKQISLNEVTAKLDVPVKFIEARVGDAKTLVSDPTRATQHLNFNAEIGIDQTIEESFPAVMRSRAQPKGA